MANARRSRRDQFLCPVLDTARLCKRKKWQPAPNIAARSSLAHCHWSIEKFPEPGEVVPRTSNCLGSFVLVRTKSIDVFLAVRDGNHHVWKCRICRKSKRGIFVSATTPPLRSFGGWSIEIEAYMPLSQVKAVAVFIGSPPQQVALPKVGMKASQVLFFGRPLTCKATLLVPLSTHNKHRFDSLCMRT